MTSAPAERTLPEHALQLGWLDLLVRFRAIAYGVLVLVYVASFNGLWRVGVDSALYRGLARSLARGDGYTFAGEHHQHAFAGVPWMLAILQKVFGESPVPGIVVIMMMALLTLWLVHRLLAMRFPIWVAVVCTIGMGLNFRFVRQSQELMTDVPFALGVMAALYGLERLRRLPFSPRAPIFSAAAWCLFGLALAAATRPTFGVLGGAIVVGSLVRGFTNRDGKRWVHFALVIAAVLVLFALFLSDPRTVGFSPMGGVYEQELVERVQDLPRTFLAQIDGFLGHNLNDAFFSQHMSPLAVPIAIVVLIGAGLVWRRDFVWGLMIVGIILVTLPLSTVPRYYLMVMPFLWLGWALLTARVALWTPAQLRGPVAFVMIAAPMWLNFGRSIGFIIEQHSGDMAAIARGEDRQQAFYGHYRDGEVLRQMAWAKLIAGHVAPGDLVVAPEAHVLAYFSDRRVLGVRSLFGAKDTATSQLPRQLARAEPRYAIFPIANEKDNSEQRRKRFESVYGENDAQLGDLIRKRVLVPIEVVAEADGVSLCTVAIRLPPPGENWKTYRPPEPTTRMTASGKKLTAAEKADLIAKRQRKAERDDRAKRLAKQKKLEREAKQKRLLKREREAKQQKLDARERRERKERRERLEKRQATTTQTTTQPADTPQ